MDLIEQLAAVCFVLALLGFAVWILQRKRVAMPRRRGARQIEIVERIGLGPQHTLALVRVNGMTLLVGTGPGVCEIRNVEADS